MSRLRRPKCSGRPKYFPIPPSLVMFSSRFALSLVAWTVLEEKVIADLDRLMLCPDADSYLLRIDVKAAQLEELDLIY